MSSVSRVASTPRNACSARPMRRICAATLLTVSTGTAKPTPTFPWAPLSVAICVFTPITSPRAFKSGPPELPGLIGASVWIALSIARLFGAWSTRPIALTIPDVIERSSRTGCRSRRPRPRRAPRSSVRTGAGQTARRRVHLQHGEIRGRVHADDVGPDGLVVGEADVDDVRPLDDVVVRDDVAGLVDHEARPERPLAAREGIERVRGERTGRLDLDDAARVPRVDLAGGQPLGRREVDRNSCPRAPPRGSSSCRRAPTRRRGRSHRR